jgi:hypothetical protein
MSKDKGPWQAGKRAWERLHGWHQDSPLAKPGHPDDGGGALAALADIGALRHLLDQAELVAVRTARKHRKSWAEIATQLGVTRQSAWERWRDLDDVRESAQTHKSAADVIRASADQLRDELASEMLTDDLIGGASRELRQHDAVRVPRVIGMAWDEAVRALVEHRLVAVGEDPDGPPLPHVAIAGGIIGDQNPKAANMVDAGSTVTLWIEPGGGSAGVREPRRPKPTPRSARELPAEISEEAVS